MYCLESSIKEFHILLRHLLLTLHHSVCIESIESYFLEVLIKAKCILFQRLQYFFSLSLLLIILLGECPDSFGIAFSSGVMSFLYKGVNQYLFSFIVQFQTQHLTSVQSVSSHRYGKANRLPFHLQQLVHLFEYFLHIILVCI